MTENIIYRTIYDVPCSIRAFTLVDENGDYNVYINGQLSPEARDKAVAHELKHIQRGDFQKDLPAHEIEATM